MAVLRARRLALAAMLAAASLAAQACGDGARTWTVRGTVHDVQVEAGQALVEHEDIPGLMPAMTMSFDVPDRDLVARMRPGQVIEFELAFDGRSYEITDFEVVGQAPEDEGWVRFGDALLRSDPAPELELVDQDGRRVRLADWRGAVLLVDFVFTRCAGPCPILTSSHVRAWRALPERVRDRVRFVSISVDPEHDTPEAMRAYAEARGVDLARWSFLTGRPDEVAPVLEAFGVGRTGSGRDGDPIEHTVITYLVDGEGRIVKRYLGLQHEPEALARDVVTLVDTEAAAGARPAAPASGP